ncbi:MAG: HigA family addiction module antitoxin [Gemmatimonadaceae bacterium]
MIRIPTHGPPTHPGEMVLEEFLKPLGMTQKAFAQRIGIGWTRANQLVNGKRGVTPDTALRLEKLFGMPADFWMTLQLRWDLYRAMRSPKAKEIAKIRRAAGLGALSKSA